MSADIPSISGQRRQVRLVEHRVTSSVVAGPGSRWSRWEWWMRFTTRGACCRFVFLAAYLAASVAASAQATTPQSSSALPGPAPTQYADTNICQTCHQEVWDKHFANTPHSA